nr:hypothetical protein [Phormidium tenue FACHB-886]
MNKAIARPKIKASTPAQKPAGKPKPKSSPQLRSLPDSRPLYSAIGCVSGTLEIKPNRAAIVSEDGSKLRLNAIKDQRLLMWLLTHTDQWQGKVQQWMLYPSHLGFTLVGSGNRMGDRHLEPKQFVIQGNYRPSEAGKFSLFIGRNNPRERGYSILTIDGNLPDAIEQDLWCCECLLTTEGLLLIAGQKMMD